MGIPSLIHVIGAYTRTSLNHEKFEAVPQLTRGQNPMKVCIDYQESLSTAFKLNLLLELHSVFHVTLHRTLVRQYLQTYRRIFCLLDLEVPELSST